MKNWVVKKYDVIPYNEGLKLQHELREEVIQGSNHFLMLLQHNSVVTLGKRTDPSHLLMSKIELENNNIQLVNVDRGGSATYHGPGQLVGYVICKSSRYGGIHNVVSTVLQIINSVLKEIGIHSKIDYENPGIWTDTNPPRKLSAVGMSNKHGYTMHGFAINVDMPLIGFSAIVPCGLALPVSTIAIETGIRYNVSKIADLVENEFLCTFNK
ncbi:MAG: lipoyl(octanoyl) transferase LipB [Candidatus Kariarchaeaceae archaeon]|jgi:lipoyl(octanoyl) transferase